ncbi:hypothetical protein ACFQU7_38635 [Pseudoroseomonas wenyumeiae]
MLRLFWMWRRSALWQPDLRAVLPETTAAHRQRLETRLGSPLSDRSWSRAVAHQGEGLGEDAMADPQFASLILLLVLPPEEVGPDKVALASRPAGRTSASTPRPACCPSSTTPAATSGPSTGARHRDPAIVFIDPELGGDDVIFPAAPSFDACMAMIEAEA